MDAQKTKSRLTKLIEKVLHECLVCKKPIKPRLIADSLSIMQLPIFRCSACQADLDKIFDSSYGKYSAHFEGQK